MSATVEREAMRLLRRILATYRSVDSPMPRMGGGDRALAAHRRFEATMEEAYRFVGRSASERKG